MKETLPNLLNNIGYESLKARKIEQKSPKTGVQVVFERKRIRGGPRIPQ